VAAGGGAPPPPWGVSRSKRTRSAVLRGGVAPPSGQIASKLGQDTEDKANNMFLVAARTGPGVVGAFKPKEPRDDSKGGAGART
jgi:hypothetical protein